MLTVRDVLRITDSHLQALQKLGDSPEIQKRWAFLVTMEEIDVLVDEMQSDTNLGLVMDPATAQHIKDGRAMLHINNVPVLPELVETSGSEPH